MDNCIYILKTPNSQQSFYEYRVIRAKKFCQDFIFSNDYCIAEMFGLADRLGCEECLKKIEDHINNILEKGMLPDVIHEIVLDRVFEKIVNNQKG